MEWCDGPYHAAERADALVIITEWDAYRALDLRRLRRLMRGATFIDLRNIYKPEEVEAAGFAYHGLGLGRAVDGEGQRPAEGAAGPRQIASELPVLGHGNMEGRSGPSPVRCRFRPLGARASRAPRRINLPKAPSRPSAARRSRRRRSLRRMRIRSRVGQPTPDTARPAMEGCRRPAAAPRKRKGEAQGWVACLTR